jgi:hypothetical protein
MSIRRAVVLLGGMALVTAEGSFWRTAAAAQTERPGRKLAFLVGVKKYDHGSLRDLEFPENDNWLARAGNRPVILEWSSRPSEQWSPREGPLKVAPGTLQKCAKMAVKYSDGERVASSSHPIPTPKPDK